MLTQNPLEQINDFKGLFFYYYLPNFNINNKKSLSEAITKNLGVIFILIFIDSNNYFTRWLLDNYWILKFIKRKQFSGRNFK